MVRREASRKRKRGAGDFNTILTHRSPLIPFVVGVLVTLLLDNTLLSQNQILTGLRTMTSSSMSTVREAATRTEDGTSDDHGDNIIRTNEEVTTNSSSSSSATASAAAPLLFDFSQSVKDVVINIGSSIDPIMPTKEMGPCARAIAVEPITGCQIPDHPQLDVIKAAVSDKPGVTTMTVNFFMGMSSSLAKVAKKDWWNSKQGRDGKSVIVPVITLDSILQSIPAWTKVAVLKTDMQGYDFVTIQAAGPLLKERVTHMFTEVWRDDVYTYHANNDLCRDWLPFMTKLGYTLVKTTLDGTNVSHIPTLCKHQLETNPVRPAVNEASAGLKEDDAYWIRNDKVGQQPFPDVEAYRIEKYNPGFTKEQYAACV